jgi:hypothetical protein
MRTHCSAALDAVPFVKPESGDLVGREFMPIILAQTRFLSGNTVAVNTLKLHRESVNVLLVEAISAVSFVDVAPHHRESPR